MKRSSGFTLIEMLIATVLLLMILATANYTYAFYNQYWNGRLGHFDKTLFNARSLMQTQMAIESAIPYVVETKDKSSYSFYFLGRDEGLTLVSASPIFSKVASASAVVRVFREQTENGFQLVYEEAPLDEELLLKLDQTLDFNYRVVMLTEKNNIKFSYYGWPSRSDRYSLIPNPAKRQWFDAYDAAKTKIQPLKVKIEIDGEAMVFELAEGHEKLLNFYFERI